MMRLTKASSLEELQVVSRFESLRKILLSEEYADYVDKPLAYWTLPSDRRLPLAFLGRTLKDLLNTPFVELTATPGIGQKKIRTFVSLLGRVANTNPADLPSDLDSLPDPCAPLSSTGNDQGDAFDISSVSEVVWAQWRSTVVKQGLVHEVFGRFAPSLKNMTRVIWNMPLGAYTRYTLSEIRLMKTHGDKRIRAILEVFHSVHSLLANVGTQDHLAVCVTPRLIRHVEDWIERVLASAAVPNEQEIFQDFVTPLLEQIRIDATQQIVHLAENRLGVGGAMASVRQAARAMGLTRARVYQLLNEINDIMNVRWPAGRRLLHELCDLLQTEAARMPNPPNLSQFLAAVDLFYPGQRRTPATSAESGAPATAEPPVSLKLPHPQAATPPEAQPADENECQLV
jgi:hypothetical protein